MWPFHPDYLKGGEQLTGDELVDGLFDYLGDTIAAPNGAHFTKAHVKACMSDLKANMMTKEMQDIWVPWTEKTAAWYDWMVDIFDCETQVWANVVDGVLKAIKLKWIMNCAVVSLWYISKWCKKTPDTWSGYHAARLYPYRGSDGKLKVRVRQSPTINRPGIWQDAKIEVLAWVNAVGMF